MNISEFTRVVEMTDLGDAEGLPPRDNVRHVQAVLRAAVSDADFRLDCIERSLASLSDPSNDWQNPPIFTEVKRGIQFRIFYWVPGQAARAHEHTSWTITAVLQNSLEITTYDWEIAEKDRRLESRSTFTAEQGAVGHIFTPCIHRPRNASEFGSASFHVFDLHDRPGLKASENPVSGLSASDAPVVQTAEDVLQARRGAFQVQLDMLAALPSRRAADLVDRITGFASSDDEIDIAVRACLILARMDRERGQRRLVDLTARVPELADVFVSADPRSI